MPGLKAWACLKSGDFELLSLAQHFGRAILFTILRIDICRRRIFTLQNQPPSLAAFITTFSASASLPTLSDPPTRQA